MPSTIGGPSIYSTAGSPASQPILQSMRRLMVAAIAFAGAVLSGLALVCSWWTISVSGSGGSGSLSFLPGDSLTGSFAGGSSVTQTYASNGLGPVGGLYEGVLAGAIIALVLGLVAGLLALLVSFGKIRNAKRYSTIRNLLALGLLAVLILAVVVPSLQPTLFSNSNPSSLCSSTLGTKTPCNSFWGSINGNGETITWGSDVGWYLAVSSAVLLFAALILWIASRRDPWSAAPGPFSAVGVQGPPGYPSPPGESSVPLDQLAQLKAFVEAGYITASEFETVKSRILAFPDGPAPPNSGMIRTATEHDLRRLKEMHDAGTISDSQYADLRRRVLDRF